MGHLVQCTGLKKKLACEGQSPKHVFSSGILIGCGTYSTQVRREHFEGQGLSGRKERRPDHAFITNSSTNPAMCEAPQDLPCVGLTRACLQQGLFHNSCNLMDSRRSSHASSEARSRAEAERPSMPPPKEFRQVPERSQLSTGSFHGSTKSQSHAVAGQSQLLSPATIQMI